MKTIINEYCAYTEYAGKVADDAYEYGSAVAQKAVTDGKNIYEVESVVIDNIMSAFATQRIEYGVRVRKGKTTQESLKEK